MIYSPQHGDTAFTVPMFDAYMHRARPFSWHGFTIQQSAGYSIRRQQQARREQAQAVTAGAVKVESASAVPRIRTLART
jgi:hypothetical protein